MIPRAAFTPSCRQDNFGGTIAGYINPVFEYYRGCLLPGGLDLTVNGHIFRFGMFKAGNEVRTEQDLLLPWQ